MKDDTSQGKKSQRDDQDFPKDEEDVDFEILDALEQLEHAGLPGGEDLSGDESMIELTIDDDMMFGEEDSGESGGFKFDANVSANLEEELLSEDAEEHLDTSFGSDLLEGFQTTTDEPFSIDLNEEDVSIDEGLDLDLGDSGFDMSAAETLAFQFGDGETPDSEIELPEEEEYITSGEHDVDSGCRPEVAQDEDIQEEKSEVSSAQDTFAGDEEFSEEFDITRFDSASDESFGLDLGGQEIEIEKEFSDLQNDIDLNLDDAFQGKPVISIGDDEVIDLGNGSDLERAEDGVVTALSDVADMPEAQDDEAEHIEEETVGSVNDEDDMPSDVVLDLHEEGDEEELDEDFMQSLGEMDIDLEEETESEFESLAEDEIVSEEVTNVEDDESVETIPEEGGVGSGKLESEPLETPALEEESLEREGEIGSEEELSEPEIDVREFLGLTLRLDDDRMQEFEAMVHEAETLQQYLEELGEHQEEVKESIFHKLHVEYIARKTVIFKSSEFNTLLTDAEQDLEDMLTTQAEFVSTIDRLNEELEEIKVRHLVGEYDDGVLAEKERDQRADIAIWNEKAEKITEIIGRYQKAIDAERELNPLRQEEELEESVDRDAPFIEDSESETFTEEESEVLAIVGETEDIKNEELKSTPGSDEEGEDIEEVETPEFEVEDESEQETAAVEPDIAFEEKELGRGAGIPLEENPVEGEDDEDEDDMAGGELYSFGEDMSSFDADLPLDGEFEEEEFALDDLSGLDDEDEELAVSYEIEALAEETSEESDGQEAAVVEDMVPCPKCGRSTPVDQKFCVHCGGKVQVGSKMISCKKCGRSTSADQKFCVHCGGKAQ